MQTMSIGHRKHCRNIFQERNLFFSFCDRRNLWQSASRTSNVFKAFMQTMRETANTLEECYRTAESKEVCTQLGNSSATLKQNVSPYPRQYFIVQSTKCSGGPTPAEQFIGTQFHINSRNHGSFSKKEREPWERGCWLRARKEKSAQHVKHCHKAHFDTKNDFS